LGGEGRQEKKKRKLKTEKVKAHVSTKLSPKKEPKAKGAWESIRRDLWEKKHELKPWRQPTVLAQKRRFPTANRHVILQESREISKKEGGKKKKKLFQTHDGFPARSATAGRVAMWGGKKEKKKKDMEAKKGEVGKKAISLHAIEEGTK